MEPTKSPYVRWAESPATVDPGEPANLVSNIPVATQGGVPAPTVPRAETAQTPAPDPKKQPAEHAELKYGPQSIKPKNTYILPITLAVIVALALAFAAYLAFKKSGGA